MNRGIALAIGGIGAAGFVTFWGIVLWFLIEALGMPWWIAAAPTVVVALFAVAVINKLREPGGRQAPPGHHPPGAF